MTEDSQLEREKGAETGTSECPECGADLELKAQPDGSVAAETCDNCYGGEGDPDASENTGLGVIPTPETPVEAPLNPDGQPAPGDAPQGPDGSENGDPQ